MAGFVQQVLTDFLNRNDRDHALMSRVFRSILSDETVFEYGTSRYKGVEGIFDFFENTSKAISSDEGFTAKPVIIHKTNDPKYDITEDQRRVSVALCSKLEEYISWFFIFKMDIETRKLIYIKGTQGMGYRYYYDYYSQDTWDFSEWEKEENDS